eukprot:TRINITY_DN24330_c0_g1_i1.p1 TRINITY_DN24330_c0_g1~~TRINITY_DN24330_c0_g1_i1.p1  ORF type:complete len:101 (-),score=3.94 TRINITY_DN24330_c0_g1_i1:29-331(-)
MRGLVLFLFFLPALSQHCALCDYVLSVLDSLVYGESSKSQLLHYLKQSCSMIPSPANELACEQAIEADGMDILQWLISGEDKGIVCEHLHLCSHPSFELK